MELSRNDFYYFINITKMKKNRLFLKVAFTVSLALFTFIAAIGQQGKKVIAVINKADWCPVCQQNGEKVMKEVIPVFNQSNVQFVMNDLTNEATKEDSKMKLTTLKIYDAVKKTNATGIILLVDEATGKVLNKISVAESKEKLLETIKQSAMSEKMMDKM